MEKERVHCSKAKPPPNLKRRAPRQTARRPGERFFPRSVVEDAIEELPEKTEITLRVTLSDDERALYETLRKRAADGLEAGGNVLMPSFTPRLRQAAYRIYDGKARVDMDAVRCAIENARLTHTLPVPADMPPKEIQ